MVAELPPGMVWTLFRSASPVTRIGVMPAFITGTVRYWDDDHAEWDTPRRAFAVAWRRLPKWVVSRTLTEVGPNATLVSGEIEARVRAIKAETEGIISVSGPQLAGLLTSLDLIDEYHLHVRPFVLGSGKPFFAAARPPLRLVSSTLIDDDTVHLVYAPRR